MSDPLAGYKPGWQTAKDDDPLASYSPDWRSGMGEDKRNETAMGRRNTEAEAMMRQKEMLEKIIPAATGDRKIRLEKQLEQLNSDLNPLGLATSAEESGKRALGGAAGAIPQLFLGATDLVLGVAAEPLQKALSVVGINTGAPITKLRERIQESQAIIDETTGAKGVEGIIGNIGGTLGMGVLGSVLGKVPIIGKAFQVANMPSQAYGQVSTATLRFLGKSKMLEPLARAGMEGNRAARAAGSAIGDLPTNVIQAMTLPDANIHDIVRSIALGTAGSVVGGALTGKQSFDKPKPADMSDFSTPPGGGTPSPEAQAMADAALRINKWQQDNPGRMWSDLTPAEQASVTNNAPTGTAVVLRDFLLGNHDNLEAAQTAYNELSQAGVSSEALVSLMGMEAGIQNGNAVMMTRAGEVPTPERLLLASGQAPRALLTAGRAESDSKMNRSSRLAALAAKMRNELKTERSERRRLSRELERDPLVPELQGVRGWEAARESIEGNPKVWVAKFDLNNFKSVNDALGQDGGNEAIRKVGQLMAANAEAYGLRAFRIGGDEFVLAGPKGKVARARDDIEAQLFGEKAGDVIYSISGGIGQNLKNAEKTLKPRKIAAKTKLGQPLSRADMEPVVEEVLPTVTPEPVAEGSTGRSGPSDSKKRVAALVELMNKLDRVSDDELLAAVRKEGIEPGVRAMMADTPASDFRNIAKTLLTSHIQSVGHWGISAEKSAAEINKRWTDIAARSSGASPNDVPIPGVSRGSGDVSRDGMEPNGLPPSRGVLTGTDQVPTKVQRYEEPNTPMGDTSKPQGLYTTPADVESPHAGLGGEQHTLDTNPDAKVLVVDASDPIDTNRGSGIGQPAGIAALRQLLGDVEAQRIMKLSKPEAIKEAAKHGLTGVDHYTDSHDIVDAIGGHLARKAGYDAIWSKDTQAPEHSEYVGLTSKAFADAETPVAELKAKWNSIEDRLDEIEPGHPEWNTLKAESAELWSLINEAEGIEPISSSKSAIDRIVAGEGEAAVIDKTGKIWTGLSQEYNHEPVIKYMTTLGAEIGGDRPSHVGWMLDGKFVPASAVEGTSTANYDPRPGTGTTDSPTTPTTPARPTRKLATIELKKPLEELTPKEINSIVDRLLKPFDDDLELINTPEYKRVEQDVILLNERLAEMNDKPIVSGYALEMPLEQDRLAELMVKPFKMMKEAELTELNTLLQNANGKLPPGDPLRDPLIDKLLELRAYQQEAQIRTRTPPLKSTASSEDVMDVLERADLRPKKGKRGTEGFTLPEAQASVVATGAGFLIGLSLQADTEKERLRNAVIGAGIVGAAAMGTFYMKGKQKSALLGKHPKLMGEAQLDDVMKTKIFESAFAEMTPDHMIAKMLTGMERLYAKTLHPSQGGEKVANALALGSRVGKEVADMMATFGEWHRTAIEWYYNGPKKQDNQGNPIQRMTTRGDGTVVPIRPVAEILRSVDGDIERLGKVAIGLSAIEQYTKNGKMPHPKLDVIQISQFLGSVDAKYIDAATAMRDVHLGLLDMQVEAGIITPKARAAMASEKYYTAMERVFGDAVDASIGKDIGAKLKGIFSPQPVKSRVGPNEYVISNPVESLISSVSRVAKAVELQDKKAAMITLWEASNIPESVKRSFMRPVTKSQAEHAAHEQWNERVKILKEYLPDLDAKEAQAMIAAFDPLPLGPKSDFMTFIRNGEIETWKLAPDLVETFRYMQGHEIATIWKAIGIGSGVARTGTAMDPTFIARMAWFDGFQSYMNSNYGGSLRDVVPGLNWVDAFYNAWKKSPEYKAFGGGSAEATLLEGIRNPADVIRRARAQGDTYTAEIWNNVKGLHIVDAYKALLTPFAEAGRFSEYLAARRHGASVQNSIRAATAVGGYYNQVGSYAAGLFHAVPFLKGSAQAMDQALFASGAHPFREYDGNRGAKAAMWFAKGITTIGLPTAFFYAANADDKEIQQLRQTKYGRRFWFFRGPGDEIFSVRKPAGPEGVLFGGTVEIALDKMRDQEPEAFKAWLAAMRQEVSLPYLPPALAATGTLMSGTDLSFGSPLVSGRAGAMPVDMATTSATSATAQTLSHGLVAALGEPSAGFFARALSPVGIEYIGRALGGSLGQESFKLADAARTWIETGSIPSEQELPIIRKFVGIDLTRAQTRDVEDFYRFATEAEKIANALAQTTSRGDVEGYISISERYGKKIFAANNILEARKEISENLRAIQELKAMPGDSDMKRDIIINLRRSIQMTAEQSVNSYRAIQD